MKTVLGDEISRFLDGRGAVESEGNRSSAIRWIDRERVCWHALRTNKEFRIRFASKSRINTRKSWQQCTLPRDGKIGSQVAIVVYRPPNLRSPQNANKATQGATGGLETIFSPTLSPSTTTKCPVSCSSAVSIPLLVLGTWPTNSNGMDDSLVWKKCSFSPLSQIWTLGSMRRPCPPQPPRKFQPVSMHLSFCHPFPSQSIGAAECHYESIRVVEFCSRIFLASILCLPQ